MAPGRARPSTSTIIGVAILLFGAVLLGVGMHHLVATGTCSSTGYSANFGPVPHCPKGTGWWILFLVGGIFLVIIGGFVARGPSAALIVPAIFGAIGVGSLTVAFQAHVSSGTKTFALIFGGAFAVCGLIPALVIIGSSISRMRSSPRAGPRSPSSVGAGPQASASPFGASPQAGGSPFGGASAQPDAIMGAYAAGVSSGVSSTPATPSFAPSRSAAAPPGSDPLDKIAKLAVLRKSGALTEEEFNREKAKLLGEL